MQKHVIVLAAAALVIAPFGARAADLVVWWEKGFYPQEDEAVKEVVAAFEQGSGKPVELVFYSYEDLPAAITAALEAGQPPDFAFGLFLDEHVPKWALEDRLVDLSDVIGPFSTLFDPDTLGVALLPNARTGRKALYALPMGRSTNHLHVWTSVLEQAGLKVESIPKEWDAFWSFWCEEVQPAVRRVLGREDVWGTGLPMSTGNYDTWFQFFAFLTAHDANYVSPEGGMIIDDPQKKRKLIQVIDEYTAIYRRGCTPAEAVTWTEMDNNQLFHAQAIVMTPNETLSIVNALKRERADDYYENTATIEWPLGPDGQSFAIPGSVFSAAVFAGGGNAAGAKAFVHFLVGEGWLAHYLNFSAERMLPAMSALSDQPFWLDPSDPHRMAAAMQVVSRPLAHDYAAYGDEWQIWAKAIYRVAADGISPEQAVDEAITRIQEILSE
jgi:multiple sugar transport system substrate-binding protein